MKKSCWTKFYNFNEVLVIKPYARPEGESTKWKCRYQNKEAMFSTENGCTRKKGGKLGQDDCGIYWIRFTSTDEHPSKFYEYIGLATDREADAKNQRGIYTRLADHVRKIQHFPHRGKIGRYMYIKQHDNGKTVEEIENILKEDDAQLLKKYQTELNEKNFNDYQEIRDFFRDKNDKDLIANSSTEKYTDYFNSHKEKLKCYESTKSFLEKNMKIRFFVIPEQEREKLYIELAEALSFDAYKKNHGGELPLLCDDDESKKLACNGETCSIKNKDKQFDLEIDTTTVEKEIGILNGFWNFNQQD